MLSKNKLLKMVKIIRQVNKVILGNRQNQSSVILILLLFPVPAISRANLTLDNMRYRNLLLQRN